MGNWKHTSDFVFYFTDFYLFLLTEYSMLKKHKIRHAFNHLFSFGQKCVYKLVPCYLKEHKRM